MKYRSKTHPRRSRNGQNMVRVEQLPEVEVVRDLPRKESGALEYPSLPDAVKYARATNTTAKDWEEKQHPLMRPHRMEPIIGYPPIEGVPFASPVKKISQLPRYIDGILELAELSLDKKRKKKKE